MKRILWIDDDARLIEEGAPLFLEYGFQIIAATNTSRALKTLRNEVFDGVLLDVRLRGGEDGLELLEEIHHIYPSLKVVVFTGYPAYIDRARAAKLGASVYFDKVDKSIPLDPKKQRDFFPASSRFFRMTLSARRQAK
jgi:DNA-binding NtrC family response regulator